VTSIIECPDQIPAIGFVELLHLLTTFFGTKRTCRGRLTISAPEGETDVPREPGHFRF